MMESIEVGPAPRDEDCAAIGRDVNFVSRNMAECRAFIGQIVRTLGEPPEGAYLRIQANAHDFGTYREVVCKYDEEDAEAVAYAQRCDDESPSEWDDVARAELAAVGFPVKTED